MGDDYGLDKAHFQLAIMELICEPEMINNQIQNQLSSGLIGHGR